MKRMLFATLIGMSFAGQTIGHAHAQAPDPDNHGPSLSNPPPPPPPPPPFGEHPPFDGHMKRGPLADFGPNRPPPFNAGRDMDIFEHDFPGIEITQDQAKKIKNILEQNRPPAPDFDKENSPRKKLNTALLGSETPSDSEIADLKKQILSEQESHLTSMIKMRLAIRSVLTPEQLKQSETVRRGMQIMQDQQRTRSIRFLMHLDDDPNSGPNKPQP